MGIYRNFISMVSMDFLFFLQCLILQQYILNWSFWNLLVMYLHKISQMRFFLTNLFQKCWSQFSKFPLHVSKVRSLMSTKLLTNYFWKIGKWKMLKISLFFAHSAHFWQLWGMKNRQLRSFLGSPTSIQNFLNLYSNEDINIIYCWITDDGYLIRFSFTAF